MRKTVTLILLAVLGLVLVKPEAPRAADGPSCGDLAARLVEINDTFLSRHAPAVEMSIVWWDPCLFGYDEGVYTKWDEACVTGELLDGTPIEGCASLLTVPVSWPGSRPGSAAPRR